MAFIPSSMAIETIRVERDNFSYVIYDEGTRNAALVDPSFDAAKAMEFIKNNKLNLHYIIVTHHHQDHTASVGKVKGFMGGTVVASRSDAKHVPGGADKIIEDGDVIHLGFVKLEFLITPGHTKGGLCIIVEGKYLLTGDTLFIGNCGRTDLRDGSEEEMYETIQRLRGLPDDLLVLPGHDYGSKPNDTLGHQKETNPVFMAKSMSEFRAIP